MRVWSKAVWGAAVAFWLMVPAPSAAQYGKVDKALRDSAGSGGTRRVIIQLKPGGKSSVREKLSSHGRKVLADHKLVNAMTAEVGAADIAALAQDPNVESISVDATVHASGENRGRRNGKKDPSSASTTDSSYGRDAVSAEGYSYYSDLQTTVTSLKSMLGLSGVFTGSGVTVAVIDSGLAPLADFQGRIAAFHDFTFGKDGLNAIAAFDDYGHGTHVAGLIGSSGVSSTSRQYAGVATNVKFLALKVLDKRGAGRTSDVIRALEFAVANRDRYNIRVINLSLGHPIYEPAATDPLVQAVENASRAGIIVVAAAGNCGTNPTTGLSGYSGIASPGNAPSAITVGAANTKGTLARDDDRVAHYSSKGPSWYDGIAKPDLIAPGQALISNEVDGSTLAIEYPSLIVESGTGKYIKLSGSSMATGVASGVVAVMLEANRWGALARWTAEMLKGNRTPWVAPPYLTSNAVKAMLQYSATPLADDNGQRYDALTQGTGLLNGVGAVTLAYYTDTTRGAGSFWLTSPVAPYTTFGTRSAGWSESMIWGTRLVTGNSIIELNQLAWGDNIVWGTGELDNIVWGTVNEYDNLVWGTSLGLFDVAWSGNVFLGDNIVWGTTDWLSNIVWGTGLIGFFDGDNIVWGTFDDDNIVWGTLSDDNIVWGTNDNKVSTLGSSLIGGGL